MKMVGFTPRAIVFKTDSTNLTEMNCFFRSNLIAETTEKKRVFVPHIREDLLNKIEALKLTDENEDDDDDFSFDESDFGSDFDDSDDEK